MTGLLSAAKDQPHTERAFFRLKFDKTQAHSGKMPLCQHLITLEGRDISAIARKGDRWSDSGVISFSVPAGSRKFTPVDIV